MAEAVLDIKQWGNSLGVRLPAAVAREAISMLISACVCRSKAIRSLSCQSPNQSLPWSNAWPYMIRCGTAANRCPRHKHWEQSVGSSQAISGRQTQTLGA